MIDQTSNAEDFNIPGHMFPLRYTEGGLKQRQGHTEAAIDLMKLANLYPAAVICEIIKKDGKMARLEDLKEFGKKHNIKLIKIKEIVDYLNQSSSSSSSSSYES